MATIIGLDKRGKNNAGTTCCVVPAFDVPKISRRNYTFRSMMRLVGYRATLALRVDDQRVDVALGNFGMVADHDGKP